jgi:peptidoglycan/xylan/chitin deacetylase (PgdA/CDA1 family)
MSSTRIACLPKDLEKLEDAFVKILGVKPLWFRPPYGSYNDASLNVLAQRGYKYVAMWSDDSGDSMGQDVTYQKGIMSAAAAMTPAPKMILQHSVKEACKFSPPPSTLIKTR